MNLNHRGGNAVRLLSIAGAVLGVITLLASAACRILAFQSFRCLKKTQRTIGKVDRAASLYIQKSEKEQQDSEDIPF